MNCERDKKVSDWIITFISLAISTSFVNERREACPVGLPVSKYIV